MTRHAFSWAITLMYLASTQGHAAVSLQDLIESSDQSGGNDSAIPPADPLPTPATLLAAATEPLAALPATPSPRAAPVPSTADQSLPSPVERKPGITINYALRSTLGLQAEGDPTLGLGNGSSDQGAFLNLSPRAVAQFTPAWSAYTRARLFLPTSRTRAFDSATPGNAADQGSKGFADLSELYLQYGGLTNYPGEAVRLGQQRIQQTGSEWWDDDIAALRWVIDTTAVSFDVGAARQLFNTRTGDTPIVASQRDRNYGFATAAFDWRPEQRIGARLLVARDDDGAPSPGSPIDNDSKLDQARLAWVGLTAENGFYRPADRQNFNYWADVTSVFGKKTESRSADGVTVTQREARDIKGYAASAGLRWRQKLTSPLSAGLLYTFSTGEYEQSGVQSNASTFAGTQTLINRYNETLRAELGNLKVATAFASLKGERNELSTVVSNFARRTGERGIVTNNVSAAPVNNSKAIGNGLDVVATHYFATAQRPAVSAEGDARVTQQRRSFVALRGSAFKPGKAYGPGAKTDYRVLLEVTLWTD